ncbi:MAG: signal peptidase I [Lachnospiraceae bacterium]
MKEEKKFISSRILFAAIIEQLAQNRQASFTVTGMSMWPLICHGRDQVIIEKADRTNIRVGDIILFRVTEEQYILHRITRMEDEYFQTTGDGNCHRDPFMPYNCIIARVCKVIRDGKEIVCDDLKWKALFRIWMFLFPVRKWIFHAWFRIRKFIRR